jgi:hypothetical protein
VPAQDIADSLIRDRMAQIGQGTHDAVIAREVKILERAETLSDGLPAPNGLGTTLHTNSGPCNVVSRPFRIFPRASAFSG